MLTIVLLGILLSLGFWQLDRAEQKRKLVADFEQGVGDRTPLRLTSASDVAPEFEYSRAEARGSYDNSQQFLLDNRTRGGRVGYEVLTPLITANGSAILVNRGWVPLGMSRDRLPQVVVGEQPRTVIGLLKLSPGKVFMLGAEQPRTIWPYRVQHVDVDLFSKELGYPVSPYTLLLDSQQPDGYVRDWRPVEFGPERNVGYAVQWFGLAAALLTIYLLVNLKRDGDNET